MTNAKIMVVEDEIIVAKDIQNRLRRFGYNVPAVASSGEEAIVKVAETYPDLVLMDIRLKGEMDGIEAARQIYNQFNIPIIYLTAYADDNTIERAKVTEAFGYLLKPFKERELYSSIEVTLSKHRMERQLKQHEQWLDTVLKSIGDGVITNDVNGSVTFMNSVDENLTGWKQEDALGKTIVEVFNIANETTGDSVKNPALEAIKEGGVVILPEPAILIARSGTATPIDDSAAPIRDDKGNITGAVLVFRDISERKRTEEARQKQIEQERLIAQLEKLNRIKDDFLSTVSHELRTPMSNMKMAIQMLTTQSTAERRQRYLEILQAECNREIELINDLLDLQRLEVASYPSFLVEAVSIEDLLSSIIEPFRSRIQERQQTLEVSLPILAPLCSDRASLERILTELLNNACKYTSSGGQITLSVQQVPILAISDALPRVPTTATLFTISNQAEIPATELLRIFDKFYRVPNADPWKQGGTGLGLALVQKLVEQLQGTILTESGEGWTTFTLQLTNLVG